MMVCFALAEDVEDGVAVQRDEPADLQLVGGDALLGQLLARFADDAVGRAPADQGDVGVGRAFEHRRRHRSFDALPPCACASPSWRGAWRGWCTRR